MDYKVLFKDHRYFIFFIIKVFQIIKTCCYQADTSVFEKMDFISHRPCSRPEIVTRYKLIEPKDNVYYYIYNDKNLLVKAGKYTENYIIDEVEQTAGFYNLKNFYYKKNKISGRWKKYKNRIL